MARFRKIDPRIWNDENFAALRDREKLVFFFLLTHPHMTSLGAFRCSIEGLAVELGMPTSTFRRAFRAIEELQMVEFCAKHHAAALPNFLRYNLPQSPNVVKSWGKAGESAFDLIPECAVKLYTVERVLEALSKMGPPFVRALPPSFALILDNAHRDPRWKASLKVCRKAMRIPSRKASLNREKENEKERETEAVEGETVAKPSRKPSRKPSAKASTGFSPLVPDDPESGEAKPLTMREFNRLREEERKAIEKRRAKRSPIR